jgi:iron complex outermembrane receptor protein
VPCAAPQNAGDSTQKGVEIELYAEPVDGLLIDGAASYLDQEFDCVNPAVVGQASGPCSSDPAVLGLLNTPFGGWKWSFGMQYEIDLQGSGSLTPRIDVFHQLPQNGGTLPGPDSFSINPGYTLANARLTWRNPDRDLSVSLEVTNLFDKYYTINRFDIRSAGVPGVPAQVGRPREWAVTVKKEF